MSALDTDILYVITVACSKICALNMRCFVVNLTFVAFLRSFRSIILCKLSELSTFNLIEPYLTIFNPIHTEFDQLYCFVVNFVLSKITHFFM